MEECVSLWPGTLEEDNSRRLLFREGMEAAGSTNIDIPRKLLHGQATKEGKYVVTAKTSSQLGRVSNPILFSVVKSLFSIPTPEVVKKMSGIMTKHPRWFDQDIRNNLDYLETNPKCLEEVQIFVMGFYYALLKPLLDVSQLTVREAYGD